MLVLAVLAVLVLAVLVLAVLAVCWHTLPTRWRSAGGRLAVEAGVAGPSANGHGYGASANNFYFL